MRQATGVEKEYTVKVVRTEISDQTVRLKAKTRELAEAKAHIQMDEGTILSEDFEVTQTQFYMYTTEVAPKKAKRGKK